MKLFKRSTFIIAVIALVALLTVTAIAGAALLTSGGAVDHGEKYEFAQASVSGKVNLKFYYSTLGISK